MNEAITACYQAFESLTMCLSLLFCCSACHHMISCASCSFTPFYFDKLWIPCCFLLVISCPFCRNQTLHDPTIVVTREPGDYKTGKISSRWYHTELGVGLNIYTPDLPDPGIKPGSPTLQADALPSEPPGKPLNAKQVTTESLWMVTTGMELKDACSLERKLWQT